MSFFEEDLKFIDYLLMLTDDVGIFQHSKYGIPDLSKGYTTDDNSRALILAVSLFDNFKEKKYLKLIYRYLAFMLYAQNKNGKFKNFMNYQKDFIEEEGSEDCFGRCIWALGKTISSPSIPNNIKNTCKYMLDISIGNCSSLYSIRSKAYVIVGLSYLKHMKEAIVYIEKLSMELFDQYTKYKDNNWHWFENKLTYGNSFLPWSLLKAYEILKKDILLEASIESMNFLENVTMSFDYFKPIGCNGWYIKGEKSSEYDEQPLEACEMLLAYLDYYNITKDKKYLNNAYKCFEWYKGKNSKGLLLIDKETGACYDGLRKNGLNLNQGSESIISYGLAYMRMKEIKDKTENNSIIN